MTTSLLDEIGLLEGTDKSLLRWDYLRQYEEILLGWRDAEFNLIEIGVAGGSSLYSWRKFFSRATIVGIDIEESARRCAGDRIHIEIGSQADAEFLAGVCDNFPPSLVIDDGSHQAHHIMASFRALFPRLAPGGWYIIEDLNITGSMDQVEITPHSYFVQTAFALLNRRPGDHPDVALLNEIDRVDCALGIVFIRKKNLQAHRNRLQRSIELVGRTSSANNHLWLAEQLMEHGLAPERAEEAAQHSVKLWPTEAVYRIGLSRVLLARGNSAAAIEAAHGAVSVLPKYFECHYQLALALLDAGREAEALAAFQTSLDVAPDELRIHIRNRWTSLTASPRLG